LNPANRGGSEFYYTMSAVIQREITAAAAAEWEADPIDVTA